MQRICKKTKERKKEKKEEKKGKVNIQTNTGQPLEFANKFT